MDTNDDPFENVNTSVKWKIAGERYESAGEETVGEEAFKLRDVRFAAMSQIGGDSVGAEAVAPPDAAQKKRKFNDLVAEEINEVERIFAERNGAS